MVVDAGPEQRPQLAGAAGPERLQQQAIERATLVEFIEARQVPTSPLALPDAGVGLAGGVSAAARITRLTLATSRQNELTLVSLRSPLRFVMKGHPFVHDPESPIAPGLALVRSSAAQL